MPANPFTPEPYGPTYTPAQAGQWRPPSGSYYGYYNPNTNYGGDQYQNSDGSFTPFWEGLRYQYLNDNPSAVWSMATSGYGGGNAAFDQWLRSQENAVHDAYLGALANNPDLSYQQFTDNIGYNGFLQRYLGQAPQQRQINPSNLGAGRVQWYIY